MVMIAIALFYFKRKSIYSFGILFYFITFSVFSNLFFDIGAPLAERFMLVPSLGICLAVIKFYFDVLEKAIKNVSEKNRFVINYSLPFVIVILGSYRNYVRCADWKDNHTLFIADVNSVPMDAKANLNAGLAYAEISQLQKSPLREQSYDSSEKYLLKGIKIHPNFPDGYLNIGVLYNWKNNYDSAEVWWNRARAVKPNASGLLQYDRVLSQHYLQMGLKEGVNKNYKVSIDYLLKAYRYDSLNAGISFNLGGAYFSINEFASAKMFWEKSLQLRPGDAQTIAGLQAVNQQMK